MILTDVEFIKDVLGGVKVQHNACGHQFCISYCTPIEDGIECPECGDIVTKPVGAYW